MGQSRVLKLLAATWIIIHSCLAAPTYDSTPARKDGIRLPLKRVSPRDNQNAYYYIELAIGSPPQNVQLHIDTGSAEVWVVSPSACTDCVDNVYDSTLSTSVNTTNDLGDFTEHYKDGTAVEGYYVTDIVGLGGAEVTNVYLGVATNVTGNTNLRGIMGIGFDSDRPALKDYPGFLDMLTSQDVISSNSYSIYLDDISAQTGSIIFGGVDSTKYTGDLVPLPILVGDDGSYTKLKVAWSALAINNSSGASEWLTQAGLSTPALLDTGFTYTRIPSDIFSELYDIFGVSGPDNGAYTVNCDMPSGYLSFGYGDGPAVWINVPFSELAVPIGDGCRFGLRPLIGDGDIISFGDTFIRSAYMNVDFDNFTIALAQSAW